MARSFDIHCVVASVLFLVSNLLGCIYGIRYRNRTADNGEFDFEQYMEFNVTIIQEQWAFRIDQTNIVLASGFINAFAWFAFIIPIIKVCWILSNCGRKDVSINGSIISFTVGGSITELLARVLELGVEGSAAWIARSFKLDQWTTESTPDNIGWKTLELVYIITSSILLWVDAAESFFLFGILTGMWYVIMKGRTSNETVKFSTSWATYGLIIGIISLFDFAAALLRYKAWMTFSRVSFFIETVNTLILIPSWLLWLSRQLPKVEEQFELHQQQQTDQEQLVTNNGISLTPIKQQQQHEHDQHQSINENDENGNAYT